MAGASGAYQTIAERPPDVKEIDVLWITAGLSCDGDSVSVLQGRVATIESIEQDYEDRIYLAVTVDDDPGRDFGAQQQPGHRFFFSPLEVEPLDQEEQAE